MARCFSLTAKINGTNRRSFFQTLIIISWINPNQSNYQIVIFDMLSQGIARSYSVPTFDLLTISHLIKIIHSDMA